MFKISELLGNNDEDINIYNSLINMDNLGINNDIEEDYSGYGINYRVVDDRNMVRYEIGSVRGNSESEAIDNLYEIYFNRNEIILDIISVFKN